MIKSAFLSCIFLLIGLQSCKVSLSGASIPKDAKTFSVAFFPNNAPLVQPTLSQTFTEELRNFFITASIQNTLPFSIKPISKMTTKPTETEMKSGQS
jgi:hypothetical protein